MVVKKGMKVSGLSGAESVPPPLKFGKNIFSGNYYVKFGHVSCKDHVKFGNFVNLSGNIIKNSGILIIFWRESCNIRDFCDF